MQVRILPAPILRFGADKEVAVFPGHCVAEEIPGDGSTAGNVQAAIFTLSGGGFSGP